MRPRCIPYFIHFNAKIEQLQHKISSLKDEIDNLLNKKRAFTFFNKPIFLIIQSLFDLNSMINAIKDKNNISEKDLTIIEKDIANLKTISSIIYGIEKTEKYIEILNTINDNIKITFLLSSKSSACISGPKVL